MSGSKTYAVVMTAALLLSACGAGASDTTVGAPTSAPAVPTTSATEAPTTAAPPTETTTSTGGSVLDEAGGSGCTPGAGELPDGEWFGYVLVHEADELELDLACWFTGEAAVRASAEDGEESPPPNDYYIRNVNDSTRTLKLASGAEVIWYPDLGDPGSEAAVTYSDWRAAIAEREFSPGVWVEVDGAAIVSIREQWVP